VYNRHIAHIKTFRLLSILRLVWTANPP